MDTKTVPSDAEEILRTISEAVAGDFGQEFFRSLVTYVAETLGVDYVLLGVLSRDVADTVDTLAVYAKDRVADNMSYGLSGTPCANVVGQEFCIYEHNVCDLFPEDILLQQMGVESYAGLPLFNSQGKALGILVVMSSKQLHLSEPVWATLKIFATRAAAEIERLEQDAKITSAIADLEKANAELQTFAFVSSHHLQEPSRVIHLYAEKLARDLDTNLTPEVKESLNFIMTESKRSLNLIRDIVTYTEIDTTPFSPSEVSVDKVVADARDALGNGDKIADISLAADKLPSVLGVANEIGMLIESLIVNAGTYRHPDRSPKVEITAKVHDGMCEFRVADNGLGIEHKYAEDIFIAFKRLHAERAIPGTGIGLALCRKIVTRHGGLIWLDIEETSEAGSVFRFTLPKSN